jgi:hypothetical protein
VLRVRATLTDNEWILLRIAVDMLAESGRDARSRTPPCLRIERAWRLGTVGLRGVRPQGVRSDIPPEGVLEEIDAREWAGLRLHCRRSLARPDNEQWRVPIYEEVQARLADIERLKREGEEAPPTQRQDLTPSPAAEGGSPVGAETKAGEEVAAPSAQQSGMATNVQEAGPLTRAVAGKLKELHPGGLPPGVPRKDLANQVREAAGATIGTFGLRTLDRARILAWPRPKRRKRPPGD